MTVPFMEALARDDVAAAAAEIGASVPEDMPDYLRDFLRYRLAQLAEDPTIRPWLGRAIVVRDEAGQRHVIGSVGFHGPPDGDGRLEIGYKVEPAYRRQGMAREAAAALFDWAHREHGIRRFVASISPTNEPSLRLAAGFGFEQVGEQMDEIDGLELVFETTWPPEERITRT
ncbi:MAG TPA: GNAT family N-acetyltransferase [Candidatus Limnocylindrales bacterium]|nr:GNAT family N-acetyltransferase [Candidatus Limnocylindrales bacterium]